MTTQTINASCADAPARLPSTIYAGDPTELTLTDLDAATGGGGPAGVNPSRGVRPGREGI